MHALSHLAGVAKGYLLESAPFSLRVRVFFGFTFVFCFRLSRDFVSPPTFNLLMWWFFFTPFVRSSMQMYGWLQTVKSLQQFDGSVVLFHADVTALCGWLTTLRSLNQVDVALI